MKRRASIACILISCLSCFSAVAAEIISLDEPIYDYIDKLYTIEGLAAPAGARPWTDEKARAIVEHVNPSTPAAAKLKEEILEDLPDHSEESFYFDFGFNLSPAIGVHTNAEDFNLLKDWRSERLEEKPVNLSFAFGSGSWFGAEIELNLGSTPGDDSKGDSAPTNDIRYDQILTSNLWPLVFDLTMVDRSSITLGTEHVSFTTGRDKTSWGNGLMGNLILSDTLPYHDFMRLTVGDTSWFRWDSQAIFFTHPINYGENHLDDLNGLNMFLGNRFEFRFWDRVRITLNEAIMYQSETSDFDLRLLNPLKIFHGFYISDNANSLASAEVEVSISDNWQVYGSFVIDDLAVGSESKAPANGSTPDSWGVSAGVRAAYPVGEGIFSAVLEGIYITPFTYHRRTGDCTMSQSDGNDHSLDYIGSVRYFKNNGVYYKRAYLSYPFGSDALAFELDFDYDIYGEIESGIHLFYMAHGVTDEYSDIYLYSGEEQAPGWLATFNPFDGDSGSISHTFNVGGDVVWHVLDNLALDAALDYFYIINKDNIEGKNRSDFQLVFGIRGDIC